MMENWASATSRVLVYDPKAITDPSLMGSLVTSDLIFLWRDNIADAIALLIGAQVDAAVVCLTRDEATLDMFDQLCERAKDIPLLIATPACDIETRILGLDNGAVDYLVTPFDAEDLLVRVSTSLRRRGASQRFVRRGRIVLDKETGRVGDGTHWTVLSPWEQKVFSLLLGYCDHPVSKQRLKSALADEKNMTDNAIEVGIHRLRLKARSWGMLIQTYRGVGYALTGV